jgi:hypothetical protein
LIRNQVAEKDADEWVADALVRAGYQKRRKGDRADNSRITAGTIREWRREGRERPKGDRLRDRYEAMAQMPAVPHAHLQAESFVRTLANLYPPGKM